MVVAFFLVAVTFVPVNVFAETDSSSSSSFKEMKQSLMQQRQQAKQELQQKISQAYTQMKEAREEWRQKLASIQDEKKRLIVERIDEKIVDFNKKHATRFEEVLEKLQSILDKIKEKAKDLKSEGENTTALNTAVLSAQKAIDAAETAIDKQEVKEYEIQISTEDTLRLTVGTTVSQFRRDLRDTHKAVVDAKQAVMNARKELAKIENHKMMMEEDDNVTPSPVSQ